MWFWLAPLIVIVLALGVIAFVLFRHLSQIAMLDVKTIKEERARLLKERIILERFDRFRQENFAGVSKWFKSTGTALSKAGRRLVQRLYKLEQHYRNLKTAPVAPDTQAAKRLIDEANAFARQDEFIQAEKRFIEVIGHHPKNIEAYEGLGNLYLKNRQFDQARETFNFALRLRPDDASVLMSLGALESQLENRQAALEALRHAVTARPKNPKYIDAYIEAALTAKNKDDAKKGIGLLKDVNPENQKLAEFEERAKGLMV